MFTAGEIVFYLPILALLIFGFLFTWGNNTPPKDADAQTQDKA